MYPEQGPGDLPPTELQRRKIRSALLFALAIVVSAAGISLLFNLQPPPRSTERYAAVGDFPSGHAWFNTDSPISLYRELEGHVVVLLFCEFTRLSDVSELIRLEEIRGQYEGQPLQFVIVYVPEGVSVDSWRGTVANWGIEIPVIVDHDGMVSQSMFAYRYPMLEVIDTHGRVAACYGETWQSTDLSGIISDVLVQGQAGRSLATDPFLPEPGEYIPPELAEGQ